jgi:hypothetical protein
LNQLGFLAKENFFIGNAGQTYIPISIEVAAKDLSFNKVEDRYRGTINFYIEVKDEKGTSVHQTSDRLEMNLREESYQRRMTDYYQYKHGFSVKSGKYFVHIVVWDEFNGNVGYIDRRIEVPNFSAAAGFTASEIVLARQIQVIEQKQEEIVMDTRGIPALESLQKANLKVPEKITYRQNQGGPFTFGNLDINPNTLAEYNRGSELVFFYQVYNPTFDEGLKIAKVRIEHQIWKEGRSLLTIGQPQEVQIPIAQKSLGLNSGAKYLMQDLEPGAYTLVAQIRDIFSGKSLEKRIDFRVK